MPACKNSRVLLLGECSPFIFVYFHKQMYVEREIRAARKFLYMYSNALAAGVYFAEELAPQPPANEITFLQIRLALSPKRKIIAPTAKFLQAFHFCGY